MSFGSMTILQKRSLILSILLGWLGFLSLPWFAIDDGFWRFDWITDYPWDLSGAPAAVLLWKQPSIQWIPMVIALFLPLTVIGFEKKHRWFSRILIFQDFWA